MGPRLTCARCGDPLGVYEPLLLIEDGAARRASYLELRDAPAASLEACELVHAACEPGSLPRRTVRTGDEVVIREVGPDDKPLLTTTFDHLSEPSRHKRFLAPINHLSAQELAYLTVDDWQHRGVGTALIQDLVAHAASHGVSTFTALCLGSNRDVIDLLSEAGDETSRARADGDTVDLRVHLPADP